MDRRLDGRARPRALAALFAPGLLAIAAAAAQGQLRVAQWNVTNYSGGRFAEFQTSIYGVVPPGLALAGLAMSPDVLVGQEFISQAGVNAFRLLLNTAPGSPGDWASAPFIDGPDTDSAFFYRTSKVEFLGTVIISQVTGSTALPPRNTYRYDVRLRGYGDVPETRVAFYSTHMKSSNDSASQQRRLLEADKIRDNATGIDTNGPGTGLPAGHRFMLCGDLNIQSSNQAAYQRLIRSEADNRGRFFDPIATPGSWNNNCSFRLVHTQDPSTTGTGGMDDRHDQILLSSTLINGAGLTYIGSPGLPYSTTTWNDPNHSYRAWGNDGVNCDLPLNVATNQFVGPEIAQALVTTTNFGSTSGGHLPVILDLRVPARVGAATQEVDFGTVPLDATAAFDLAVFNAVDGAAWTNPGSTPTRAVETLVYTLTASEGFDAAFGPFEDDAEPGANHHTITMDTSSPGPKFGTLLIHSNAPDAPELLVLLSGVVVGCAADFNGDGSLDFFDYLDFVQAYNDEDPSADFNRDGSIDFFDYLDFVLAYDAGC